MASITYQIIPPLDTLAHNILSHARSLSLDVCITSITPANGNCWYWAILDQVRRPEILPLMPHDLAINYEHRQLRQHIVTYVRENADVDEAILDFREWNENMRDDQEFWRYYVDQQATLGTGYASDLFLILTALCFNVRINITSNTCNIRSPFYKINDHPTTVATLWLGHYEHPLQPHFQSLMPNSNNFPILDFNIIPPVHVQRPMKKAVLKDKHCTSESLARKKKNGARKRSVCAKIVEIDIEAVDESLGEKKI